MGLVEGYRVNGGPAGDVSTPEHAQKPQERPSMFPKNPKLLTEETKPFVHEWNKTPNKSDDPSSAGD